MISDNPYVIPLDGDRCRDPNQSGAKAARLSKLVLMGFPVPKAFVLTIAAFQAYCRYNGIEINETIHSHQKMPALIRNGRFPEDLRQILEQSLGKMNATRFAVRSSSAAEDGHDHSMAGQYHTFLNTAKNDVPAMIKECWAGLYNTAALAYSKNRQLNINHHIGVIVQQQIDSHFSGVLFTMDPHTKSSDHFVIEWVKGLGDKLVSGLVTPKRVYVSRNSGGINEDVDAQLRPFLLSLIDLAFKAEKDFNYPIDMEWCADKDLHVLQIRPVTALVRQDSTIWTNVNMTENFPHPLSPFTWSIVDRFYTSYMTNILEMFGWTAQDINDEKEMVQNLTGIQGGRIYYNLSNWYKILNCFPVGRYLKKFLDNYIGQKVPFEYFPDTDGNQVPHKGKKWSGTLYFWLKLMYIHVTARRNLNLFELRFQTYKAQWRKTPYHHQSLTDLVKGIDGIFSQFIDPYYHSQGIADICVLIFPGILNRLIEKWLPEFARHPEKAVIQLFQGIDIKSSEPAMIIAQIAGRIQSDDQLLQLLKTQEYEQLEQALDEKTKDLFDRFIYHFGARCYNECMIVSPTFEERHDLFWNLVEKYSQSPGSISAARMDHTSTHRNQFLKSLENHLTFFQRMFFNIILKNSHKAIGLREQGRLVRSLLFGEIRLMSLEIGKRLMHLGYIETTEDVYNLQFREIEQLATGKFQFPETVADLVALRKSALEKCLDYYPSEFFISEPGRYDHKPDDHKQDDHQQMLNGKQFKGKGVSAGVVTAKARVVLDPVVDNRLKPGEILVTRSTDPGWTPLFGIAGGLLLEKGGLLSHGAIVSREFCIPAVVGVENVTRRIKDGDTICLDGVSGKVEVLGS